MRGSSLILKMRAIGLVARFERGLLSVGVGLHGAELVAGKRRWPSPTRSEA